MVHAYRLVYPPNLHAPHPLWEWQQPYIDHLLWNAFHQYKGSTAMRVGILELLAESVAQTWGEHRYNLWYKKSLASLTPQAVAAWCRQLGHEVYYATYGSVLKVEMDCDWCHTGPHLDSVYKQGVAHDFHRGPMSPLSQRADHQTR
jgi:hypothetical protein